jgi:hypothetical protein
MNMILDGKRHIKLYRTWHRVFGTWDGAVFEAKLEIKRRGEFCPTGG